MIYRLYFDDPAHHLIRIEIDLPVRAEGDWEMVLSKWRPGRYEIAPYAENIVEVRAQTAAGAEVPLEKLAYNRWWVPHRPEAVTFTYKYYANVGNAGSSWFTESFVYFNGVNFFMYCEGHFEDACEVHLDLPDNYRIACGLPQDGTVLMAENFHQLVDAPLIASATLQHDTVRVSGVIHHLWFQGETSPNWSQIKSDFLRFGEAQTAMFGGFPVSEYHYLFIVHNKHFYHGVEHYNSTAIALGPGYRLMQPELYEELLGVSCHELFHTWNVKAIRPADMQPYDYDRENYSQLHYVTEGVTTYYGDLMLLKSGVWDLETYLRVFNNSVLKRHYNDNGRDHVSLEQASYDSWLVGYKSGVPNRKISFYTKGALAAFILDYLIRKGSENARSLDTVLREMYARFGKPGPDGIRRGYTREDYKSIAEAHAGHDLDEYFSEVISGTAPLEERLQQAARYFGLEMKRRSTHTGYGKFLGFRLEASGTAAIVKQVHENSPADRAGLHPGDEIIALNGLRVNSGNLTSVYRHFMLRQQHELHIFRHERLQKLQLIPGGSPTPAYMLTPGRHPSREQLRNLMAWIKIEGYRDPEA